MRKLERGVADTSLMICAAWNGPTHAFLIPPPCCDGQVKVMQCSECRDLNRFFELATVRYQEARSSPFFLISTEIAASRHVNMLRALSDLLEHQQDCLEARALGVSLPRSFVHKSQTQHVH